MGSPSKQKAKGSTAGKAGTRFSLFRWCFSSLDGVRENADQLLFFHKRCEPNGDRFKKWGGFKKTEFCFCFCFFTFFNMFNNATLSDLDHIHFTMLSTFFNLLSPDHAVLFLHLMQGRPDLCRPEINLIKKYKCALQVGPFFFYKFTPIWIH